MEKVQDTIENNAETYTVDRIQEILADAQYFLGLSIEKTRKQITGEMRTFETIAIGEYNALRNHLLQNNLALLVTSANENTLQVIRDNYSGYEGFTKRHLHRREAFKGVPLSISHEPLGLESARNPKKAYLEYLYFHVGEYPDLPEFKVIGVEPIE